MYISRWGVIVVVLISLLGLPWQLVAAEENSGSQDLDLTSTVQNIQASGNFSSATIETGGMVKTVLPGDALTVAENIALQQVLATGQQALTLSAAGSAISGHFDLTQHLTGSINNLVIPTGVSAIGDFSVASAIALSGNLSNAGFLYALSSNPAVSTAAISAANIFNQPGALISTVLPAQGFAGYSSAVDNLSLSLFALQNIVNAGTITSSNNLSLTAGGSIVNALPSGISGINPVMQAAGVMNLQALNIVNQGSMIAQLGAINIATANLNNAGLIASLGSNISIINSLNQSLGLSVISSTSGAIEALNGSVSFGVVDRLLKEDMNVLSGTIRAQSVAFDAGEGFLNVNLDDIHGPVDVYAGTASFVISNGTAGLTLRTFEVTGDPPLVFCCTGDFSNGAFNSLGGVVDIDTSQGPTPGSITFTGDINTTPSGTGNGGAVTLKAGTTISTQNIITSANTTGNAGSVTITAAGSINTASITAAGAGGGSDGGIIINAGTSGNGTATHLALTGGAINVDARGAIALNGVITGNTLTVQTLANNGNITFAANDTLSGAVVLTTHGSGNVTQTSSSFRLTSASLAFNSTSGALGTSGQRFQTAVGTLTANNSSTGGAFITDLDGISVGASTVGGIFRVSTGGAGNLTTTGVISVGGSLNLITGGTLTVGANLFSAGPSFTAGNMIVNSGATVSGTTAGSSISITTGGLQLDGNLSCLTCVFGSTILPNGAIDISVGGSGGAAPLDITAAELNRISLNPTDSSFGLRIGDQTTGANLTISGDTDLSSASFRVLDLRARNVYSATGTTLTLGSGSTGTTHYFARGQIGSLNTGAVSGGSIVIFQGGSGSLTVDGNITLSTNGQTQLFGGSIFINNNVTVPGASGLLIATPGFDEGISVGAAAKGSGQPFEITLTELGRLSAGNLQIGGASGSNQPFFVNGDIDLSTLSSTNISFSAAALGTYTATGRTITVGANQIFTIQALNTFSGNITGGSVTFSANSTTSVVNINGNVNVTAANGTANVTGAGLNLTGTLQATGTNGVVFLQNTSGQAMTLASAGGPNLTPFDVSITELGLIRATSFQVSSNSAAINQVGDIDVSGAGPFQAYTLNLTGGGSYSGAGVSINAGTRNVTINVSGVVDAPGVTTTSGNITFRGSIVNVNQPVNGANSLTIIGNNLSGDIVNINSDITLTGLGNANIQGNGGNGNLVFAANVSADTSLSITTFGTGNVRQTAGLLSSGTITFSRAGSGLGDLGSSSQPINTATGVIRLPSTNLNNAYITNVGDVSVGNFGGSAIYSGQTFQLRSSGNITIAQTLSFTNLDLQTTANNGNILFTTTPSVSGQLTLTTHGSGSVAQNLIASASGGGSASVTSAFAFNPTNSVLLYITNVSPNSITVNNTSTGATINIPTGTAPNSIVVNNAGTRAYVGNSGSNNLTVINTTSNTVVTTVGLGSAPRGVAIDAAGGFVYVSRSDNTVAVIDTTSNAVVASIAVGIDPRGVAVDPTGNFLYVANFGSQSVSKVSTASRTVVATINIGQPVKSITAAQGFVYVAVPTNSNIAVIDTVSNVISTTIPIAAGSIAIQDVVLNSYGTVAYVTNGNLNIIDTLNHAVSSVVAPSGALFGSISNAGINSVAVNTAGTRVASATSGNFFSYMTTGILSGASVSFNSTSGSISNVQSSVNNLSINTSGNVQVANNGAIALGNVSGVNLLQVRAGAGISTSGPVSATNLTFATLGNNADITLGGATTGTATATLTAVGSGRILPGGGSIGGGVVTLRSGTGDIGASGSALSTSAATLLLNTTGSAFIAEVDSVNLGLSSLGGTLRLLAGNSINTTGIVSASDLTLQTTTNDIVVDAAITATDSGGDATLLAAGNITGAALITGDIVNFTATSGGVGTSASGRVNTATATLTANAAGDVFVSASSATGNVTLDASAAGDAAVFDVLTSGVSSLTVVDDVSGGVVNLTAGGTGNVVTNLGAATVEAMAGAVSMAASGGNIQLNSGNVIADTDVNVTGQTGVSLGATGTTSLSAGSVDTGLDPRSEDLDAYGTGEFASEGGVNITAVDGTANIMFDSVNTISLISVGNNVNIVSGQDITVGENTDLFAQGANVVLSALDGTLTIPDGAVISSVARYVAGGGTVNIDGQTIDAFQGGSVAIWAGPAPAGGFDTYLTNLQLSRLSGTNAPSFQGTGTVNIASGTVFDFTGGGSIVFDASTKGSISVTGLSTFQTNGGVIAIDPVGPMILNNVFVNAFGPLLLSPPAPVPGGGAAAGIVAGNLPPVTVVSADATASRTYGSIVATDTITVEATALPVQQLCNVQLLNALGATPVAGDQAWIVVSNTGQVFSFTSERSDSMLLGTLGTIFAPSESGAVILRQGKLMAMSASDDWVIKTSYGLVKVAPSSAAIVEQRDNGVVRVANLIGSAAVTLVGQDGPGQTITASAGQELLIAAADTDDESLMPVDTIIRKPIEDGDRIYSGLRIVKNSFSPEELTRMEDVLISNIGCYPAVLQKKLEQLKQGIQGNRESIGQLNPSDPAIVPIAFRHPTSIEPAVSGLQTIKTDSATIKYATTVQVQVADRGLVDLQNGEVLVVANKNTVLNANSNRVLVKKGGLALLAKEGSNLKVRGIWTSGGGIQVFAYGHVVNVRAGEEAILHGSDAPCMHYMNDAVARRHIVNHDLGGKNEIISSEVSLESLIENSHVLRQIILSDNDFDRSLVEKMVKMAACLMHATKDHGTYSQMSR